MIYSTTPLTPEQFLDLLNRSTLGERRPIDDPDTIAGMVANADITLSAWDGDKLIGVARSVTTSPTAAICPTWPSMSPTSGRASASN